MNSRKKNFVNLCGALTVAFLTSSLAMAETGPQDIAAGASKVEKAVEATSGAAESEETLGVWKSLKVLVRDWRHGHVGWDTESASRRVNGRRVHNIYDYAQEEAGIGIEPLLMIFPGLNDKLSDKFNVSINQEPYERRVKGASRVAKVAGVLAVLPVGAAFASNNQSKDLSKDSPDSAYGVADESPKGVTTQQAK